MQCVQDTGRLDINNAGKRCSVKSRAVLYTDFSLRLEIGHALLSDLL